MLTGLLEQIKITDFSVLDNLIPLIDSIDELETTSINQDGTDVNDAAAEEETRKEIHKIEEDPNTRDGEMTMRLTKAERYVTFWVKKGGSKAAKVVCAFISKHSEPVINAAKLRIAKTSMDLYNAVFKEQATHLANSSSIQEKKTLTICMSYISMLIFVVVGGGGGGGGNCCSFSSSLPKFNCC